jgi:hypothetical protein
LNGNKISDEGAEELGEAVSKLLNLTCLNLHLTENEINRQGSIFLGNSLSQYSNFPVLSLIIE